MNIKKYLPLICLSVLLNQSADAQMNNDSLQKFFTEFKRDIQYDFNKFKTSNDSIFVSFLRQSWEEFELMRSIRPEETPKPIQQPAIEEIQPTLHQISPLTNFKLGNDTLINTKKVSVKVLEKRNSFSLIRNEKNIECEFYGTDISFNLPSEELPVLNEISNNKIANYYEEALNSKSFQALLFYANRYRIQLKLNGWAYLKLCHQISKAVYADNNLQLLSTWFLMTNSAYKTKIAYSNKQIYLLGSFNNSLFNISYCEIDNEPYYLYFQEKFEPEISSLYTYSYNHKKQINDIDLQLNETPLFFFKPIGRTLNFKKQTINLSLNKNLINFYADYPDCDMNIFLNAPLSDEAVGSFDKIFMKDLEGRTDIQTVNYLLNFVQHAFPYQNDLTQFGNENYLFPDESLYYPYCDCEDRVALMAQLVKRYTGLECVALDFPGHVSLAVNILENIDGDFLSINEQRFYVCDPTYIGAKCGMNMPQFKDSEPKLIQIN